MLRTMTFLVVLTAHGAVAAPPPPNSEDYKIMQPYAAWVVGQHDILGRWCCDIGDGRPVEAHIQGDHWMVHVTPEKFPAQTVPGPDSPSGDRWMAVPENKVTRGANPTGAPILWMYQGRIQCFAPPDGV